MGRAGEPVEHDIGDHLVLGERFVRLRTTVAPAAKLLDVPGRQAGGGVCERVAQGQWLRSLYRDVCAFGVRPLRNPGQILFLGRAQGRVARTDRRTKACRKIVEMQADDSVRMAQRGRGADPGPPIAALHAEARIVQRRHQFRPEIGDDEHVRSSLRRPAREPVARDGRRDDSERIGRIAAVRRRVREQRNDLEHLDDASRPTVRQDQRDRRRPCADLMDEVDTMVVDLERRTAETHSSALAESASRIHRASNRRNASCSPRAGRSAKARPRLHRARSCGEVAAARSSNACGSASKLKLCDFRACHEFSSGILLLHRQSTVAAIAGDPTNSAVDP